MYAMFQRKFLVLLLVVVNFFRIFLTAYYSRRNWGFLLTRSSHLVKFSPCCFLLVIVFLPMSLLLTRQIVRSGIKLSLLKLRSSSFLFLLSIKFTIEKIILSAVDVWFLKAKKQLKFCPFYFDCNSKFVPIAEF